MYETPVENGRSETPQRGFREEARAFVHGKRVHSTPPISK